MIVAAAGNTANTDCKQNPIYNPLTPNDSRDWAGVTTVVTPAWFSDYVLTVGAVDSTGAPLSDLSVAGPWVSIAAPGTDVVSLSPRDDGLINASEGPDNAMVAPGGHVVLGGHRVRGGRPGAREVPRPDLASGDQPADPHRPRTGARGGQPGRARHRRPGRRR